MVSSLIVCSSVGISTSEISNLSFRSSFRFSIDDVGVLTVVIVCSSDFNNFSETPAS